MSELSGYDSEVVGFDSVSQDRTKRVTSSSQTTEFFESGTSSQTNLTSDAGCMVQADDLLAEDDVLKEYPPPGLNAFLRRVVPAMMEQLDQNDRDFLNNSSDSDEDEVVCAKLIQEIKLKDGIGSGDHETSILGVTWSSAGNSFAVSIGQMQHETWCENAGLIKVFTLKRGAEEKFVHSIDVSEKNCVTTLKYHPTVAALLAYGTTSGEVVLCNLRNGNLDEGTQLTSPSGCHGSRRVTALQWADASLANIFLLMQINNRKKRRGAADQVLFSSGTDGTINVWQVNVNLKVFENIVCYNVNSSRGDPCDITCFDFIKTYPLRPSDEKTADDVFVVGSKTGKLFLCKIQKELGDVVDPVYDELEGHGTCVLDVAFSIQRPGVFVSISMDSELRVYDITQSGPLKVICLDTPISCVGWLVASCVAVGVGGGAGEGRSESVRVYNVASGRAVPVGGLGGRGDVSCLAVNQNGYRLAAGDKAGVVRVWELPARHMRLSAEDLDF